MDGYICIFRVRFLFSFLGRDVERGDGGDLDIDTHIDRYISDG